VLILGATTARELLDNAPVIGHQVRVVNVPFTVVGCCRSRGSPSSAPIKTIPPCGSAIALSIRGAWPIPLSPVLVLIALAVPRSMTNPADALRYE
jgi:hypothetical protein